MSICGERSIYRERLSNSWEWYGVPTEAAGGAALTRRCDLRLPCFVLASWCDEVGDGIIDGKPIELDESSESLVEKGLLVVIEFSRTRVFDNSEVGDEANDVSSEAFLFDLYLCCLILTGTSLGTTEIGADCSRPGLLIDPLAMDEGEAFQMASCRSGVVDESAGESGVTARMVFLTNPSRSGFPSLAGEIDRLLECRSSDCICDWGRPEYLPWRSRYSRSIVMAAHVLDAANQTLARLYVRIENSRPAAILTG